MCLSIYTSDNWTSSSLPQSVCLNHDKSMFCSWVCCVLKLAAVSGYVLVDLNFITGFKGEKENIFRRKLCDGLGKSPL